MYREVDARGLSCPEPVLITSQELNTMSSGTVYVRVSNVAAGENITRMAKSKGWQVEFTNEGEDIVLTLRK